MADCIAIPLGKEARLYYGVPNAAVTCAAQAVTLETAGVEIVGIRDLTLTIEKDDVDTGRRRSHGWEDARESIKRLRISFNIFNAHDLGIEQAAIDVLRKTFGNGTYNDEGVKTGICFYALSCKSAVVTDEPGPQAPDGEGICADFIITKFERTEPYSEPQEYSIEARMTQAHCRIPAWV